MWLTANIINAAILSYTLANKPDQSWISPSHLAIARNTGSDLLVIFCIINRAQCKSKNLAKIPIWSLNYQCSWGQRGEATTVETYVSGSTATEKSSLSTCMGLVIIELQSIAGITHVEGSFWMYHCSCSPVQGPPFINFSLLWFNFPSFFWACPCCGLWPVSFLSSPYLIWYIKIIFYVRSAVLCSNHIQLSTNGCSPLHIQGISLGIITLQWVYQVHNPA